MKLLTNIFVFLTIIFSNPEIIHSQTLRYPSSEECKKLRGKEENYVSGEKNKSYCDFSNQTKYVQCMCEFENELSQYKAEYKLIEDLWQEAKLKSANLHSEAQNEYMEGSKMISSLFDSDQFHDDKAVIIKHLKNSIKLTEEAITFVDKAYKYCLKLRSNCNRNEILLQQQLEQYRASLLKVEKFQEVKRMSVKALSSDLPSNTKGHIVNTDNNSTMSASNLEANQIAQNEKRRIETDQKTQAAETFTNNINSDLQDIFSGEFSPMNTINITQELLKSGLIESIDGIVATAAIGTGIALGVGIAQEITKNKIKQSAQTLKESIDKFDSENINLMYAIKNDSLDNFVLSYNKLIDIENTLFECLDYLIQKTDDGNLQLLKNSIENSRQKRYSGRLKYVKFKISKFDKYSKTERQEFASSGLLNEPQKYSLKNPELENGICISYHDNWEVNTKVMMVSYKRNGSSISYDEEGNVIAILNFENDVLIGDKNFLYYSNGRLKASFDAKSTEDILLRKFYSENGLLLNEHKLLNGKFHGEQKVYYRDGGLKIQECYNNGVLNGEAKTFYKNGQLQFSGSYVDGIQDGEIRRYYLNGNLKKAFDVEDGKVIGVAHEYFSDGAVSSSQYYENGFVVKVKSFYENGSLEFLFPMKNNIRDGISNWYYRNGQLRRSILYKSDFDSNNNPISKRVTILQSFDKYGNNLYGGSLLNGNGILNEYDEYGVINRITEYEDGVLVNEILKANELIDAIQKQLDNIKPSINKDNKTTSKSNSFNKEPLSLIELIDKTILALGGLEKLEKVKSLSQKSESLKIDKNYSLGDTTIIFTTNISNKDNSGFYQNLEVHDQDTTIIKVVSDTKEMIVFMDNHKTGRHRHKFKETLLFKELGFSKEIKKYSLEEKIEDGKNYFVVKFKTKDVHWNYYYSADNFLLQREETIIGNFKTVKYYRDYENYDGILFPTVIVKLSSSGRETELFKEISVTYN